MTRRAAGVDQAQAGQLVLQAIFDHFRTTGRWPTADNIDRQLRRRERGLDVARLIVDMPRELVPRTWPNGVLPRDHDVRRLSPFGIARCLDAGDDVDLYLRALRWLASYEERTDPERGQTSLMVTHRQLARALRVPLRDSVRLQRLFQLLQHERWGGVGSGDAGGGTSWHVNVGREVRHFRNVRGLDDLEFALLDWLGFPTDTEDDGAQLRADLWTQANTETESYVDPRVLERLAKARSPRWDTTKLVGLATELVSTCRAGNVYAAHAILRALLDHIPPLFGQASFDRVVATCPGRTDKKYLRYLEQFRSQGDGALHRQIGQSACLLSLQDMPPRAIVNRLLAMCAERLEVASPPSNSAGERRHLNNHQSAGTAALPSTGNACPGRRLV